MKISAAALLIVLSVTRLAAEDVRVTPLVTLMRLHSLARAVDGRLEANRATKDEAEARRWLTALDSAPLFRTAELEANTEYYVRVRARAKPPHSLIFWPWDRGLVSMNANFTFIP